MRSIILSHSGHHSESAREENLLRNIQVCLMSVRERREIPGLIVQRENLERSTSISFPTTIIQSRGLFRQVSYYKKLLPDIEGRALSLLKKRSFHNFYYYL